MYNINMYATFFFEVQCRCCIYATFFFGVCVCVLKPLLDPLCSSFGNMSWHVSNRLSYRAYQVFLSALEFLMLRGRLLAVILVCLKMG